MEPAKLTEIKALHAAYMRLTGLAVALDLQGYRAMLWSQWLREGFSEADLARVVHYVRGCIRGGERGFTWGSLRFNTLIGQPDRFGELLAEAQAAGRGRVGDRGRAGVLRATGRDAGSPKSKVQSFGDVAGRLVSDPAKAAEALEQLRKMKASL
jgi:hypothetical protein